MSLEQTVVEIKDYSCRYGKEDALNLKGISLEVKEGEFLAVMGPSGGGKSTLAFSINGIIPHEIEGSEIAGDIRVMDFRIRDHHPNTLIQAIGTVMQDPEWQIVNFTVEDELAFGLENLGIPPKQILERIRTVAKIMNLTEFLPFSPDKLSGGQKQRVSIAACLALETPILLLDEPIAELDPVGKATVLETVAELNKKHGLTVIFIDHNIDMLAPYADRVAVISEGMLQAVGTPKEIFGNRDLMIKSGLRPPQLVELDSLMAPNTNQGTEIPLTVDEFIRKYHLEPGHLPTNRQYNTDDHRGSNSALLTIDHVDFGYQKGQSIISNLNLVIHKGDFIGLAGQNGAGKTTAAKLLTGLLTPTRGEIRYNQQKLGTMKRADLAQKIGYVFQNPDFQFFTKTCFDEIAYGLRLRKLPEEEVRTRVDAVMEILGVSSYRDQHPHFLSRGERRRVAIASVVVLEPEVIILDEPTTGLDSKTSLQMLEFIKKLHHQGHTIIMLTHEMRAVLEYCNRMVLIQNGEVILDEPPAKAFTRKQLLETYQIKLPILAELFFQLMQGQPTVLPVNNEETAALLNEWMAVKQEVFIS